MNAWHREGYDPPTHTESPDKISGRPVQKKNSINHKKIILPIKKKTNFHNNSILYAFTKILIIIFECAV